jgi:hypothetical protein
MAVRRLFLPLCLIIKIYLGMKVRTPIDLPSVNRDIGPTTLTGCGKHPQQAEVMRVLVLISATDTKRKGERKRTECRGVEVTIEPESQGSLNRKFFVY